MPTNTSPTFVTVTGGTGKVTTDFGGQQDYASALALQADGKILVAGDSGSGTAVDFALLRLNTDGSLDTTFAGTGGFLQDLFGSSDYATSVLVQADGKIVVVGYAYTGTSWNFAAIRYHANGTVDTGYGNGGAIGFDIRGGTEVAFGATLQADGKVVLSGYTQAAGGTSKFAVVRLTTAGQLDTTFNGSGAQSGTFGGTIDAAQAVAVQADGKIVVVGYTSNDNVAKDVALVRYNANGTVDTTFGSGGGVTTSFAGSEDVAISVKVQPDGKILVAGYSNARGHMDVLIVRYNANGSYDTTFGNGGALQVDFGWDPVSSPAYDYGYSVTLQDDGKIVVVGATGDGYGNDVAVARFNTDGSADTAFAGTGKVTARFNADFYGNDVARAVSIQPDGQIVVAGYVQFNSSSDIGVLRFNADGSLDMRFGGTSSNTLGSSVAYIENAAPVVLDNSVRIFDLEMSRLNFGSGNYAGATLTLARSGGASAEDVFSGSGSLVLAGGSAKLGTTIIGSYAQTGGTLTITFNGNATQARVDQALSAIAYSNTSDAPTTAVQLTWTFSDGTNTGTGTSTVNITRVNDAPTGWVVIDGTFVVGQVLGLRYEVTDLDGREVNGESWQWRADGVDIPGANARNYTLTAADAGKTISAAVRYIDFGGTLDGLVSAESAVVAPYNSAPTFTSIVNGTGKLQTDIAVSKQDYASAVAIQNDGSILVAGTTFGTTRDMAVVRYTADGVLDTSFSGTGKVLTSFGTSTHDYAYAMATHTGGYFLVAGSTEPTSGGTADFMLVRHQYGGTLDSVFAGGGKVAVDFGGTQDYARSVVVQADNKILVAGTTSANATDFALARFNADGSLDTTFNATGKVTTHLGTGSSDYAYAMAVQADGRIVLVGSAHVSPAASDFAVVRYNSNGTLDTTFNGTGFVTTGVGTSTDSASSVAVQRDGKIVVAGYAQNGAGVYDVAVVRYNANGTLDTGFGSGGKLLFDLSNGLHDYGYAVTLQGDGKILVGGRSGADGNDIALLRLNTDGSLDTAFNGTGKATAGFGPYTSESAEALVLQADGRMVVAGTAYAATNDFAVARFNTNGTLDSRFGGTVVNTLGSAASYTENAAPVALDSSVSVFDLELAALGNYAGAVFILDEVLSTRDVFSGVGRLTLAGGNASLAGTVIGTYTQANARLEITFNGNATQARVDEALSSLAYASTSDTPGATATLRWTLTDGSGPAALIGGGITQVNITRVNDLPTGAVTVSGAAMQGSVLTAGHTLADAEGLGTVSWQWLENGGVIAGANSATFTLTSAQVGKTISVRASYVDGAGTAESVTSAATASVTPPNSAPTGNVTVTLPPGAAMPTQNHVLTASHTLADANGMGTIAWQWLANGEVIAGATSATFTLTQAQVGKAIAVRASYVDGIGAAESVTSTATAAVANVNDAPTGSVTITGTARQGQTLTASNTLADADGLGTISYQWLANGTAIEGASGASLVLGQAQVGKTVSVRASYSDGLGAQESVTSTATVAVVNVNDLPSGSVAVTGGAEEGQTLTASHTLADIDGLGSVAYQWLANGNAVSGATGSTLVLGQPHVGQTISVRATYTDGQGTIESITSTATGAVANVNDAPGGAVTIAGTVQQGRTLTASHALSDEDGIGMVQLQWFANGEAIAGATGTTLTLAQAQVGKAITVTARYTDAFGAQESVTSPATAAVANVNDAPTGGITIGGNPAVGQTMTVTSDTLADVDGLGAVTYHWIVGGTAVATGSSYTLAQADAHKAVLVEAVYTDGQGTTERVRSGMAASLGAGNDSFSGATGTDTLQGNLGNDTLTGGAGNDTLDGGGGDGDVAVYSGNGAAYTIVTVNGVTTVTDNAGTDGVDTLTNFETLRFADVSVAVPGVTRNGTPLADVLVGTTNGDTLMAFAGDDYLYGGSGNDSLYGGDGIDVLLGEDGDDVIQGDGGQDYVFGGNGHDTMYGGDGIDVFSGGAGNDLMFGGAGDVDHFYVEAGNNTVYGEAGVDILVGGADNDVYHGGADNDYAYAGAGNDSLYGGDGVDVLLGEAGDDFFDPGTGTDYLYLGAGGNDTVLVGTNSGIQLLYDFEIGGSNDRIQLHGTGWTTLADVVANTYDYVSFSIVQVDVDTAIWIIGARPADFTAADFVLG